MKYLRLFDSLLTITLSYNVVSNSIVELNLDDATHQLRSSRIGWT